MFLLKYPINLLAMLLLCVAVAVAVICLGAIFVILVTLAVAFLVFLCGLAALCSPALALVGSLNLSKAKKEA